MMNGNIVTLLESILRDGSRFAGAMMAEPQPVAIAWRLAAAVILLCAAYGFAMGLFAGLRQALSSSIKLPILFMPTLVVCFPVLFVVGVFLGSPLTCMQTLALVLSALALQSILFIATVPMVVFFTVSSDYHFMKLMHVAILGITGLCGLALLNNEVGAALGPIGSSPHLVFFIWFFVFGFVGCQMAWMLRPFLGEPHLNFQILRARGGEMNFYRAVAASVRELLKAPAENRGKSVAGQAEWC